ncbi:MAG: preprotein translocase subunit SecE [Fuerstiella sp.]|nr:preprotein translocase subunit SecE [Fuerstiella sp.]
MSSKGMGIDILPELFRFALYKSRQGRMVRRSTFISLAVLSGFGAVALAGQLQGVMADSPQIAQYIRVGVPLAVWAICCWISFRVINFPKFADFLISVEAELERVVWPGKQQVVQATIVVIVVMVSLGIFLTVADFVWKWLFKFLGFIDY